MGERFFDITDSDFGKALRDYFNDYDRTSYLVREFVHEVGLDLERCGWRADVLFIKPNDADIELFGRQLKKKAYVDGYRAFKLNSFIGKLWKKKFDDSFESDQRTSEPKPQFFKIWKICKYGETHSARKVIDGDRIYYSITGTNAEKLNESDGYIELKGSDFHHIIESLEQAND
ncbi:hypothetical protein Q5O14_17870 [Eubacteriaceae bacterium ES2]|nr:hypothetical protein Q5O14_17870 [Eubacteriaceae bacterium ES2]